MQTFHDMLPHTVSGDGHITRVVHSGANYGTYLPQAHTQSHGAAMSDNSLLPRGSTQQSPRPLPANKHPQSKDHPMPVNMATPRSVVPLGGQEPIHSDGLKDSTNLLRRNPEHGVNAVDHEESERPLLKTSRRGAMDEMLDDVDRCVCEYIDRHALEMMHARLNGILLQKVCMRNQFNFDSERLVVCCACFIPVHYFDLHTFLLNHLSKCSLY